MFNRSGIYFSGQHMHWELSVQVHATKRTSLLVIVFSQAPQFSFVQSDVMVDSEVVQPAVLPIWVDLKKGRQDQEEVYQRGSRAGFKWYRAGFQSGPSSCETGLFVLNLWPGDLNIHIKNPKTEER